MVVLQMESPIECDSFVYIMSKQSDTEKINKKKNTLKYCEFTVNKLKLNYKIYSGNPIKLEKRNQND